MLGQRQTTAAGDSLIIRPPRVEDAPALYEAILHPAVLRHILLPPTIGPEQTEARLKESDPNSPRLVAEVNGRPVGSIGLRRGGGPRRQHLGNIGMSLHPAYWGQGIGSALLAASLDIADNWLNLVRVELEVFADNERGQRLYEKFGFEREGTRRRAVYGDGRWADAHLMARIRPPSRPGERAPRPAPPLPAAGERLPRIEPVIRPLRSDDADDIFAYFYQPAVARYTAQMPSYEFDRLLQRVNDRRPNSHRLVAEYEGRVIGDIGLHQKTNPREAHCAGLAMTVHPAYWGRGVGTALMAAVIELADNWFNIGRIELEVNVDNPGAIRLYEKFGFEREGTIRYHLYGDGRWLDSHFMARLRR